MNELISEISLKFIFKKMRFSLLKTFANFFLMNLQLQRHEIKLIIEVSIEFTYF